MTAMIFLVVAVVLKWVQIEKWASNATNETQA